MKRFLRVTLSRGRLVTALFIPVALCQFAAGQQIVAPAGSPETSEEMVQRLTVAVSQAQQQISDYQQQLQSLQDQLAALQRQMALERNSSASINVPQTSVAENVTTPVSPTPTLQDLGERQAMEESQIATHELSKVETASKFPLRVSGLVLFNAFVNTRQVDSAADPSYVLSGGGSTGLSIRQTVLGLDAHGPHMFGGSTRADLRTDFYSSGTQSGYSVGMLRLRTAHAEIAWEKTAAFFQLDRPLFSPFEPTSLIATAQPELAWSGNLWTWNPQAGLSQRVALTASKSITVQAALIDVADPAIPGSGPTASLSAVERSRWPGSEARIAFSAGRSDEGFEIGAGGYFSPHETSDQQRFNAWAGTADLRLPLGPFFEVAGTAYRGAALGGLGGGGFVDYVDRYSGSASSVRPLDDAGGWAQLKFKPTERLQLNGGFGADNPFASEIPAANYTLENSFYPGLDRNRSIFGNAIYSPSAYLLFSLEYRRILTNYINQPTKDGDVIGIGAGYRF